MNGLILGVQIYIIIGMILAFASTVVLVNDLAQTGNREDLGIRAAKSVLTGNNAKLIFTLIGTVVLVWPVALAMSIMKNMK